MPHWPLLETFTLKESAISTPTTSNARQFASPFSALFATSTRLSSLHIDATATTTTVNGLTATLPPSLTHLYVNSPSPSSYDHATASLLSEHLHAIAGQLVNLTLLKPAPAFPEQVWAAMTSLEKLGIGLSFSFIDELPANLGALPALAEIRLGPGYDWDGDAATLSAKIARWVTESSSLSRLEVSHQVWELCDDEGQGTIDAAAASHSIQLVVTPAPPSLRDATWYE